MIATVFAISAKTVTNWGLYFLIPLFIGVLVYIMWDLSKKSGAGRAGTFWIFLALGLALQVSH